MTFQHVVDRQLLHFPWAFTATVWVWVALYALRRVVRKDMLPRGFKWVRTLALATGFLGLFVRAALLVLAVAFLREPLDVGNGDPAWKSYVDCFLGWAPGCAAAVFLMYRIYYWILTWAD